MIGTGLDILQIVFADIILSGDNALVIGMAAAGLPPEQRRRAIFYGMALAAGLRIFFAAIASVLLTIPGILFFGGILLVIVCWRFYRDLKDHTAKTMQDGESRDQSESPAERKSLSSALVTIAFADVSMSIDNVVAVAAIARENTALLVFGLALAILFMALFATIIMRIMARFSWLSWAGLVFLMYLSGRMLYDGWPEVVGLLGML